jgi:hypothetical protein
VLGALALGWEGGEAAPQVGVSVGAEDAGGDDVVERRDERVLADVDGLGVLGGVAVEAVGVVAGQVAHVVGPAVPHFAEHPLLAQSTSDVRAE